VRLAPEAGEKGSSDELHNRLQIRCSDGIVEVSEGGMLFDSGFFGETSMPAISCYAV
jgi:hypothetical protein